MRPFFVFWRLIQIALSLWRWMLVAIFLGVMTITSSIGLMALAAYIIARAALQPSIADLQVAIVGVRFFGIARGVFRYLERYVSHEVTFRLLAELRVRFYAAVEPFTPARLLHHESGDLLARIITDVETLEHFYVRVIAPPVVAGVITLGMTGLMALVDVKLALATFVILTTTGVVIPLATLLLSQHPAQTTIQIRSQLKVVLLDGIQGCAEVTAFGRGQAEIKRMQALNHELANWQQKQATIDGLNAAFGVLLTTLAIVVVLALAIPNVRSGRLDGVNLGVLVLATSASFEAVLGLPLAFQYLSSSLVAGQRLFDIMDTAQTPESDRPIATDPIRAYDVAFEHVSFRYSADEVNVLDDVSLHVQAGECLVITGPSGVGKTTLVNLLLRFGDTYSGTIRIGGQDIRRYDAAYIRSLIAIVPQKTHLFNTSVRENLLLARRDATEDDLIQAAQQAEIHDFIRALPQGYDTWIGEQGYKLSAGERQRIAIARALVKDTPILILDEATANLDAITTHALQMTLNAIARTRTMIVISHNPERIHCDRILALPPASG